jgi:DNA repair protein RecO (recombination protein O)
VSEILKDRALILRTYVYGESSLIVVALTREHGKMRFLAKGARRNRSPFSGRLGTGSVGNAVFYYREPRGLQLLKECETVSYFRTVREDLERICVLQAGLEIADRSIIEREGDEHSFDLVELFTRELPAAVDPWTVFFTFEARLLFLLGFFPALRGCGSCGGEPGAGGLWIDPRSGEVSCQKCSRDEMLRLSPSACAALDRMRRGFTEETAVWRLGDRERSDVGRVLHQLFLNHIEGYTVPNALRLLKGVN